MAQQSTVKRSSDAPATAKRNGRPPGSRNPIREKVFDYDGAKKDFHKPEDFYAYLNGYPDKTGLLISVYRLRPVIDHGLIGNDQSAILQTADVAEASEDAIAQAFGRGKYMLKVNDSNRPRGDQQRCRTWLELNEAEKPPQYDVRTLCLGEVKNQDEITRLLNAGVLIRDAQGTPRLRGEGDPVAASPSPVPSTGNGHGGELFGRDVVGQIVLAALNRGTQSPHDTVKDTIEIAKLLTPAQPAFDLETVVDRVVTRLQGAGAGAPGDMFRQYDQVEKFIERVRGPVATVAGVVAGDGAAAGEPGSAWAPHLGNILAQARALIPDVLGAFREFRATNGANGAPQNNAGPQQRQVMTLEQRIEDVLKRGFQAMQEGVTGFDFASWVCFHYAGGLEVYQALEPSGAQGLIALAAMNPAARSLVNDAKIRPQLESFLTDFFSFDPSPVSESEKGAGAGVTA